MHCLRDSFVKSDCEAALLVDAFNRLNRKLALHNIQRICPSFATILTNTYRSPTDLFIDGETIYSQEGTAQGDPLAMPMYALATIPLIKSIDGNVTQLWYADDLWIWWEKPNLHGPQYRYHINPSLIVKKDVSLIERFTNTGLKVTSDVRAYLGSAIGSDSFVQSYSTNKIRDWCLVVSKLANIAMSQPHAAYSAWSHGIQHLWTIFCRVTPNICPLLHTLDVVIRSTFLSALTRRPSPNDSDLLMYSLRARQGVLAFMYHHFEPIWNIKLPLRSLNQSVSNSHKINSYIVMKLKRNR